MLNKKCSSYKKKIVSTTQSAIYWIAFCILACVIWTEITTMNAKKHFVEFIKPILEIVFFEIVGFLSRKIYKTQPGNLYVISDPIETFVLRLEAVVKNYDIRDYFLNRMKGAVYPDLAGHTVGYESFEDIGTLSSSCIKLEQGTHVITLGESRRGISSDLNGETSFKQFSYVKVMTPRGIAWVEEVILTRRLVNERL